jgi:hypothetical protein
LDCSDGVLVEKVEDFVVIEGPAIHKGDRILKINEFPAKNQWRDLLKGGAPNFPFRLQFVSRASGVVSSCVIYKQLIDPVPSLTHACGAVSNWHGLL